MGQLRSVDRETLAIVVGKAYRSRGEDGTAGPPVRLEGIRPVAEAELRSSYAEILEHTLTRLDLVEDLKRSPAGPETPMVRDAPRPWRDSARECLRRYPNADLNPFRRRLEPILIALESSQPLRSESPPPVPVAISAGSTVTITRLPQARATPPGTPTAAERAHESEFLDLIDELCESSIDGYAELKELLVRCAGRGVSEERAEELLNHLEAAGTIEEPIVGRLRRA
jgi:hypothetical protein